uniref:Tripartite motif containing 36 n=1 Tax=Latimeria chalumnae TaxID=7897 RepID=H3AKH0_LATCH
FIGENSVSVLIRIRNIERELICPVCKELFTHPLILPCQHSVCHKCVKELFLLYHEDSVTEVGSESSNPGSPRSVGFGSPSIERIDRLVRSGRKRSSLTPRITTFPCPGCQCDIDLGERGVNGLFRNFTLETIVERYRQAARAATAIMCDLCKPPPQEATKSCMDCKASYCNECFKIHHPWGTPKAQHEYVGPTTNFRPKVLMCPEHEMEKVNMYCEMCRRPVCHLCKLGGSHANHRVTSMSSAYRILKEKLAKSIHYLISKEDQVKTQIFELEHLIEQTESNGQNARKEADAQFERLFKILEERQECITQSIEDSRLSRLEKLRSQVEEYQGMLENSGLVGYAQEVLKETDQSCFVQTAKELHTRVQKATESLKTFCPAAHPSFQEFVLDVSKEEDLLCDLSFTKAGTGVPVIKKKCCQVYNESLICWEQPGDTLPVDHYVLEYRKLEKDDDSPWQISEEVHSSSTVISDLDTNSVYSFRVKGCRNTVCSPYSKEVSFHTPPAPVFRFLFDDKCGYNTEHLNVNKKRDSVECVAGFSLLLGAERIHVGCYTSLDYIIGDTGITKGKHFWAFQIDPHSYLVKVGVASDAKLQEWLHNPRDISSPRYDQDSGHDSGSEDTSFDLLQPFTLVAVGMRKFFIPKGSSATSNDYPNRALPMPDSIGICLDYDRSKVTFYDVDHMKCLYERQVDCSGTMYPAFALMGSGGVHLEEFLTVKRVEYPDDT